MKKLLVFSLLIAQASFAQIKFDISKLHKVEVEKLVKESSPDVSYFELGYGGHEFIRDYDFKKLENRIVEKVQYVYSDFPKDFDYSELDFQRFAAMYTVMPQIFNKPWIKWEIVKQTKCNSTAEASKLFHGFVVTFKKGPEPNMIVKIPPDIQKKLDELPSSVEFFDIKSADDLTKFLSIKETKIGDLKYTIKNGVVKLFKQNKASDLSIAKGLFLTTGLPIGAIGPNNSPSISSVNSMALTPDMQLGLLVAKGSNLFDLAVVEFDIRIDADSLIFQYAFASEEYPEFLEFNDVFGLFITGTGLNNNAKDTTYNLATLPDGKTPISVSSINHLVNTPHYIPNDWSTDLKLFKTWQYDGFTKVQTARIKVKPNQKYHVKFAIADYADPYFDSAIFIDAFGIKSK